MCAPLPCRRPVPATPLPGDSRNIPGAKARTASCTQSSRQAAQRPTPERSQQRLPARPGRRAVQPRRRCRGRGGGRTAQLRQAARGPAGLQARLGQRIVAHDRRLLYAAQAEEQHGDEPGAVLAVHAVHQDREVGGLREQPQRGRDWRVRLRARPRLAARASILRVNSGVRCRRASGQRQRRANLPRGLPPRSQQGGRCRCRKRRPERPGASRGAGRRTAGWTRISAFSLEARAAEWSG